MKFLKVTLCTLLLLSFFLLPVAAESVDAAESVTEASDEAATEEAATVTETVVSFLSAHTGDILCILTFLSSLFTVRAYKIGLLPTLSGGIGKLTKTLESGIGAVREQSGKTDGRLTAFLEECKPILTKMEALAETVETVKAEKDTLDGVLAENLAERTRYAQVMEGQIELLYGILQAANLPAYQKDALGEAYLRVKGLLTAGAE